MNLRRGTAENQQVLLKFSSFRPLQRVAGAMLSGTKPH